nr:hypothetical protein [Euzebyales bacterium]MBA3620957.1 hypothetical protein [Euzebyales bacterium]
MSPPNDPLHWLETERHQPGGSRVAFQRQLQDCHADLVSVAGIVAGRIVPVTEAFLEADSHAARQAIMGDVEIDRRCERLEEACFLMLARQSPVAGDLRHIVAMLRSIADVQRSGDLLRHVATSLAWVHPPSMGAELRDMVSSLGTVSGEVFAGAVDAWQTEDALAAVDLQRHDDAVDLLQKSLLTELYTGQQ